MARVGILRKIKRHYGLGRYNVSKSQITAARGKAATQTRAIRAGKKSTLSSARARAQSGGWMRRQLKKKPGYKREVRQIERTSQARRQSVQRRLQKRTQAATRQHNVQVMRRKKTLKRGAAVLAVGGAGYGYARYRSRKREQQAAAYYRGL